jgi:hypothetical protein
VSFINTSRSVAQNLFPKTGRNLPLTKPCSASKANPPDPSFERLCYKNGPFVSSGPSAVRVPIRSRSTSAKPPSTASIKRPMLVPVSAHGFRQRIETAPWYRRIDVRFTMPNKSKVPARQPVNPRHRHHVAGRVREKPMGARPDRRERNQAGSIRSACPAVQWLRQG